MPVLHQEQHRSFYFSLKLEASTWSVVILVMGDVADKIQKVRVFPMTFENVMADEVNFSSSIEHALVGYCRIY